VEGIRFFSHLTDIIKGQPETPIKTVKIPDFW
jgi:hypothetical protein